MISLALSLSFCVRLRSENRLVRSVPQPKHSKPRYKPLLLPLQAMYHKHARGSWSAKASVSFDNIPRGNYDKFLPTIVRVPDSTEAFPHITQVGVATPDYRWLCR